MRLELKFGGSVVLRCRVVGERIAHPWFSEGETRESDRRYCLRCILVYSCSDGRRQARTDLGLFSISFQVRRNSRFPVV